MDVDIPTVGTPTNGGASLLGSSTGGTTELQQILSTFKATRLFRRKDLRPDKPSPHVLSLDFNDPGDLCMTSESDETIQLYNVREGRHDKNLASKKYGVKLAKFTHSGTSIIYASTKQNDAIRYLETFDNSFIRYFEGHKDAVTNLEMHPGGDNFLSASRDNTVRLWDIRSKNAVGQLFLNTPYLLAWDPSGEVFAVGSPRSGSILLYDYKNYNKAPFATFDIVEACKEVDPSRLLQGWTKLEFSNDGKCILLGTDGTGHLLLDAFDGKLKANLRKPDSGTSRVAPGEGSGHGDVESSGDCCFTPDGRFVMGANRGQNVSVWDVNGAVGENKRMDPAFTLEDKREAAVLAFNPRFNFFATADRDLIFWMPDPYV
ncbi:hypothetical protein MCOR27_010904 [Pyricularia oryzae]|uniref:Uncharacterized protein n=5 Tax=Pyricularia TaxID=48558 RepID=A0ABQ8N3A5_PYRGI|nr:uncharacterized protein MGG_06406 [Pyricularia oryzae 70-15]ELQ44396.1 SET1 complex component swd2 [Pyricularia oryzae Y34]KAI6252777.1 hypothetical protein MCOR19_010624 [Pyricularia oryzae]KAI6290557.1 hypothetical protein MCOR33_011211 [Pyricularia grisea]EHA50844.1 hypothetical protein MGG_06406 [Pyricularia oryzae 70-15]KAI6265381.1 hypothetical protein MCOR26_010761 [Pyricularia oryzae]